jgi:hypothetical protein
MSSKTWVNSPQLDVHVRWLLDQLEERKDALTRLLSGDVRADIFCYSFGVDSRPPELPKTTLARADALGIQVEVDHYSAGSDSEDDEREQ